MFLQIRHLPTYPHGAKGGFSAYVGVRAREDGFDFGEQVAGHFDRGNVSERTKRQADNVLVGVVEVAVPVSACRSWSSGQVILLGRVCNQRQDFLVLV
jgi:hypothetical protein